MARSEERHTRRYVSDERRSQPGWIGRAPAKVIFERRLSRPLVDCWFTRRLWSRPRLGITQLG